MRKSKVFVKALGVEHTVIEGAELEVDGAGREVLVVSVVRCRGGVGAARSAGSDPPARTPAVVAAVGGHRISAH